MEYSHTDITKLTSIPDIRIQLIKAAFKKTSYNALGFSKITLPSKILYFDGLTIDADVSKSFHQLVDWDPMSEFVHPCYLHSLAFPLHVKLLLLPEFVLPLLGLVHVSNQIKQLRPIKKTERLIVSTCFGELELHPKGWLFSIKVEFHSGFELVWQSTSTNLFRAEHDCVFSPIVGSSLPSLTQALNTTWDLSSSLGRQYAKVSGDFNPIHLNKWLAKLFGFKQHIIHGMLTKSYCISALQKVTPSLFLDAFEVNTTFKQPVYLPSEVTLSVQPYEYESSHAELHFKVVGKQINHQQQPLHIIGKIISI
ncbi:MAG: acyl dehydratase [Gammaproteobacteria bacterium]|jgi:acyl dehydratase